MSQWENNYEEALQLLPKTISAKNGEGAGKTESISTGCIYRVPDELRKLNESPYTPHLIAIGPLHQDDKHLQTPMQQVKKSYANHLLHRLTEGIEDPGLAERTKFTLLQECAAEMKMSMDEAQKCYAEDVTLDVEMMLVDGCFILELLYRFYESKNIPKLEEEQEKPIRASTSSSPLLSPHLQDSDFDVSSCGFGYSDVVGFAEMKMSIDKAQKCYAEDVMLDEEMMLVDGCFILEHLYIFYESKNIPKEDRTRRKAYRRIYIIFTSFVSPFTGTFNKTLCRQANKERGREISDT
ncbi:hypothetical protein RHGRI_038969 [Rhododendron griersonianum]|uniref:Uncharacterized protein n=1 Tax=Rhododendron griersonianum TaxID=479676 RepID=A0AAV6HLG7_9ERIC|nr:hypothetical protein RHGRI_038969 [Rhododendron griersonianum]